MTPDEIREVVKITLEELENRKTNYLTIKPVVENKLNEFFNGENNGIGHILRELCLDPYLDIIYSYYRDGLTQEEIAEDINKDVSTIKRNQKRLLLEIYKQLEEM